MLGRWPGYVNLTRGCDLEVVIERSLVPETSAYF